MKNEDKQAIHFWYGVIGAVAVVGVIVIGSLRQTVGPLQDGASVRENQAEQAPFAATTSDDTVSVVFTVAASPAPAPFVSQGFSHGYGSFEFRNTLPETMRNQAKKLEKAAQENALLPEEDRSSQALTQERIQALRDSGRMIQ